jgi:hypothetical protein
MNQTRLRTSWVGDLHPQVAAAVAAAAAAAAGNTNGCAGNSKHNITKQQDTKRKTQLRTLCVDDLLPSYLLCRRHAILNQEQCTLGTHRLLLLLLLLMLMLLGTQTDAQETANKR